ncbi:MAG: hypothetical protein SX243_16210 [Acidobacteriota bacterium]|nr:hypothetical protein [Acidobacteriota bacterium]
MSGTKPTETHAMSPDEARAQGIAGVAGTARTRTGAGVVEDLVFETPMDIRELRTRRIIFWGSLLVLAALVVYRVAT